MICSYAGYEGRRNICVCVCVCGKERNSYVVLLLLASSGRSIRCLADVLGNYLKRFCSVLRINVDNSLSGEKFEVYLVDKDLVICGRLAGYLREDFAPVRHRR